MRQTDKGFVDKRFRGRSWHFYRCISKPRRLHFPTSPLFSFSRSRSGLRHYLDLTVTGVRFLPQEQHPYRVASLNSVFRRDCHLGPLGDGVTPAKLFAHSEVSATKFCGLTHCAYGLLNSTRIRFHRNNDLP